MKLSLLAAGVAVCCVSSTCSAAAATDDDTPLFLTKFIERGDLDGARTASHITGLKVGSTGAEANMGHAGFFSIPSESGKRTNQIYSWLQPCSNCNASDPNTPFIVWFQGGPGAPGNFGSFQEIGNYYVDEDLKLQERCYTWCASANCMFVDQPTMTGFSFQSYPNGTAVTDAHDVEYTTTSPIAMEQVYQVLVQMFTIFPEHKSQPLYITGESYGGVYTGNFGYVLYNHNKALLTGEESIDTDDSLVPSKMHINFVGLAVGDPVLNAEYQWPTYADTLYGMGVVMLDEKAELTSIFSNGVSAWKKWEAGDGNCTTAFNYWNSVWEDDSGGGLPGKFCAFTGSDNSENVLLSGQPAAFDYWTNFMIKPEIRKAMHTAGSPSTSSAEGGTVYSTMVASGDFCQNSSWLYATLFENANIDLMIYSSTADALLGPPTTEAGVMAMLDYSSDNFGPTLKSSYLKAPKVIWRTAKNDTSLAGYARCTENSAKKRFCYTVIRNGGHETPAFQPRTSLDMFERFRLGRSFRADGDLSHFPTCAQCSGVPPFAGKALPECN
jgi:hypothetical protein